VSQRGASPDASQHADGGGLGCAVGPEEAVHLTGRDREIQPVKRDRGAETFDKAGYVAYLSRTGLANRDSRVDHYVVEGTTWADSPAHARMTETREFFEFVAAEMPKLIDRWHESR